MVVKGDNAEMATRNAEGQIFYHLRRDLSIKPLEHQGVGANEPICINVNEFPNEKKV